MSLRVYLKHKLMCAEKTGGFNLVNYRHSSGVYHEQENLKPEAMKQVLDNYEFNKRLPRKEELKDLPNFKVKLFERDGVLTNLFVKTRQLIERFYVGFQ